MLDIEIALPTAFILLAAIGLAYAAFAGFIYFRFERDGAEMHVPVALSIYAIHYVLALGLLHVRGEALLPSLLLFGMLLSLLLVIWLGSQAGSKAGIRIALAGLFTLAAFACLAGHEIYQSTKFSSQ